MKVVPRHLSLCATAAVAFALLTGVATAAGKGKLLQAMQAELERSMEGLGESADKPPYFVSYLVTDSHRIILSASYGSLTNNTSLVERLLDVEVRVGDYQFDNTHRVRGLNPVSRFMSHMGVPVPLPLEDDTDAIRAVLWLETDKKYKSALERLITAESSSRVQVEEEDQSADFSHEDTREYIGKRGAVDLDVDEWTDRIERLSALLDDYPEIDQSQVQLTSTATTTYLVNTEGTVIRQPSTRLRLMVYAETKADDGMDLHRFEGFEAHTPDGLPGEDEVRDAIERMAADLLALRAAPTIEPYAGPAILSGRATGVFFHEIFGHRVEGHRQKDEEEGQTFTKKVGQVVLPDFISVYDDPTLSRHDGLDLNGHYLYDDEGVEAQRVAVVENGVLKNFLMSRSPVEGFDRSNGHGRKQAGRGAVGRQGNLIVETTETVTDDELREMLMEECKQQNKPYGLLFVDISGGFTITGRGLPQSFQVTPIMVYRVYADGSEDELVRGVDLIGTPLASFSEIRACSDRTAVFNGTCGAESGWVPVSAIAPSILTAQIEVQKKQKSADRPPLLAPPAKKGGS